MITLCSLRRDIGEEIVRPREPEGGDSGDGMNSAELGKEVCSKFELGTSGRLEATIGAGLGLGMGLGMVVSGL